MVNYFYFVIAINIIIIIHVSAAICGSEYKFDLLPSGKLKHPKLARSRHHSHLSVSNKSVVFIFVSDSIKLR